jgi:short subunit dehydrogenase-like uncharacterized protein
MGSEWMLYGATGATGKLILDEALRRGQRPVLAGRSREKLETLAWPHGLEFRVAPLDDAGALRAALAGMRCVLHAAGPYIHTAEAMQTACLEVGASCLDLTGELPVFVATFEKDARARAAKVALISGVGFDVVPSDCLALHL